MPKKREKRREYVDSDGNPVSELVTEYEITQQDEKDALNAFQSEKDKMFDLMKKGGIPQSEIDELEEHVQTPDQLETAKQLAYAFARGVETHGGNTNPDPSKPPAGSVVTLPRSSEGKWKFANAREAIDTLYDKLQTGTDEEKRFADRAINLYWQKLKPTIEHGKLEFLNECVPRL